MIEASLSVTHRYLKLADSRGKYYQYSVLLLDEWLHHTVRSAPLWCV